MKPIQAVTILLLTAVFLAIVLLAHGEATAFDREILLAMRGAQGAIGPAWLLGVVRDLTALGSHVVLILVVLIVASYLLLLRDGTTALFVVASALSGTFLNALLKLLFSRPRPDIVDHLTEVASLSFPSGHAASSAVIYLTIGFLLAGTHRAFLFQAYFIGVAILLTLLVGFSRIYLGVHYPTDVIGGWSFGAAWALLCLSGLQALQRKRIMQPPENP